MDGIQTKILVVGNDPNNHMLIEHLDQLGYVTEAVQDGKAAAELLKSKRDSAVSAILVAVNDADSVREMIHTYRYSQPLIVVGSHDDAEKLADFVAAGADDY